MSYLCCDSVTTGSLSSPPVNAELCRTAEPADDTAPSPRFVTNEELHILQTCLTRWRTEVEQDIKGMLRFIHSCLDLRGNCR